MGRASRLKRERQATKSIQKEIEKDANNSIPTFREWPCQMWKGKKVLLPDSIVPFLNKDGILCYNLTQGKEVKEVVVTSFDWKLKQEKIKAAQELATRKEQESKALLMQPTKLGNDE